MPIVEYKPEHERPVGCSVHRRCRTQERRYTAANVFCYDAFCGGEQGTPELEREFERLPCALNSSETYLGFAVLKIWGEWKGERKYHEVGVRMWYTGFNGTHVTVAAQLFVNGEPATPLLTKVGLSPSVQMDTAGAVYQVLTWAAYYEGDDADIVPFDTEEAREWQTSTLCENTYSHASRGEELWLRLNSKGYFDE